MQLAHVIDVQAQMKQIITVVSMLKDENILRTNSLSTRQIIFLSLLKLTSSKEMWKVISEWFPYLW